MVSQICSFYLGPVNRVRPIVAGTVLRSLAEYSVPTANLPVEPDTLPDAPHESALSAARERRESEQLITDWEGETQRLGHALALMTLDLSAMTGPKWTHFLSPRPEPRMLDENILNDAKDNTRTMSRKWGARLYRQGSRRFPTISSV
jgi:hypothetical protein